MKQKTILIILLIISLSTIILNDFILNDTPEVIPNGDELGQILSRLSLAFISSFIFYLLVVVLKGKKDKANINKSVYQLTKTLISHGYGIYGIVAEYTEEIVDEKFNKETISKENYFKLCEKCDLRFVPKNRIFGSPINPKYANIAGHIYDGTVTRTDKQIEKIFKFIYFLDTDFVALLNELRDSDFFGRGANLLIVITQGNVLNQMVGKHDSMYRYLEIIRKIEDYNETHHAKYK